MKLLQNLLFNKFYKLLFYILPLLLLAYFFLDVYYLNSANEKIAKAKVHFGKREKSIKLFDFVKDLEKRIAKSKLEVKNLKIDSKSIVTNLEGDFIQGAKVIEFIEKYSPYLHIKRVKFDVLDEKKIDLNIEVELSKSPNYYKKQDAIKISSDILYEKNNKTKNKNSKENKEIKIAAIIDKSVLINDTWYKVGNFINEKEILLINSDHIVLKEKENIKNIWMYNNEFTR